MRGFALPVGFKSTASVLKEYALCGYFNAPPRQCDPVLGLWFQFSLHHGFNDGGAMGVTPLIVSTLLRSMGVFRVSAIISVVGQYFNTTYTLSHASLQTQYLTLMSLFFFPSSRAQIIRALLST